MLGTPEYLSTVPGNSLQILKEAVPCLSLLGTSELEPVNCRILPYVRTDETAIVWWKLVELQAGFKRRHEWTDYTRCCL